MSWLGVQYALACRDERVKGSTRLVLVVLGARVEYRRITTAPTSLDDLWWGTFLSHEQLRRILDDLETYGEVVRLKRGKHAVYGLPRMAGPLFVVDTSEPVKMTDFVLESLPKKTGQDARKAIGRMPGFSGRRAGGVLFSERTSTNNQVPPTPAEQAVAGFLTWFHAEYRTRRGYPYRVKRAAAERVVAGLLADRSVARLQAMALLMFDAVRDQFILDSDYSLFVLEHKATYLEGIAVANERRAAECAPLEANG